MRADDFDFDLPEELIAQTPAPERSASRLLVFDRRLDTLEHRFFHSLPDLLRSDDLVVVNNSKVVPARLWSRRPDSSLKMEVMLIEEIGPCEWWALLRPGRRARLNSTLPILDRTGALSSVVATVREKTLTGTCRLEFTGTSRLMDDLTQLGEIPLPPYIHRAEGPTELDRERYQVVYAQDPGSVAAPTAGLHFTQAILQRLAQRGVEVRPVTLHVGLGTFAPVKSDQLTSHELHQERYAISPATAEAVEAARAAGRRVVAVGTTSVRVLEHAALQGQGHVRSGTGATRLFIFPPRSFQVVDALITNFHLPRSSLLMLVAAFVSPGKCSGRDSLLRAYAAAIEQRYRFYSYGDAMFIH